MTNQDSVRFAKMMVSIGLAYSVEVIKERISVFWLALGDLSIEAVEYAAQEAIKFELKFPNPAKLREYAKCYRSPMITDLTRRAIPNDCTPPEVSRERLSEIFKMLNTDFGTDLKVPD